MASLGAMQVARSLTPEELAQLQAGGDPQQAMLNQTVPSSDIDTGDVMDAQQVGLDSYLPQPAPSSPLEEMMLANPQGMVQSPAQQEMLARAQAAADASTQAEQEGIKGLEDYINKYKAKPTGVDLSALGGLLSSLDPRFQALNQNLQGSRPETESAKAEKLMGLMQKLQASKSQAAKNLLSTLNAQLRGQESAGVLQSKMAMRQNAIDEQSHRGILNKLANDKTLSARLGQYQGLDNALQNIANSDTITPEQLQEFQQAIRSNMGIKGTSGVGEREETYFKGIGLNVARMKEFLQTKPIDISNNPEIIDHLKQLAGLEQKNIDDQFKKRINAVTSGKASMYSRRPDLKSDLDQAIGAHSAQVVAPEIVPHGTSSPAVPSTSGVPSEAEIEAQVAGRGKGPSGATGEKAGMAKSLSANKSAAGKVTVSDGKETLIIPQSDLAEAMKAGFQEVK